MMTFTVPQRFKHLFSLSVLLLLMSEVFLCQRAYAVQITTFENHPKVQFDLETEWGVNSSEDPSQSTLLLTLKQENNSFSTPSVSPAKSTVNEASYPENLYEFDASSKGRDVDFQNALSEYYNDRMRELSTLLDKVNMLAGQNMHNNEKYKMYQEVLEAAGRQKNIFESTWFQRQYGPALSAYEKSKELLLKALFQQVPKSEIEGRAIWLDRGSIVSAGSPEGLRQLIQRIAKSGFNMIYFETINAGYPIYPSQLIEQNPQVKGWDPLAVAIDESHRLGVELHAWVWVFAVGNTRHNKILGQPLTYPGPVLSRPELMAEAMHGRNAELVPAQQYEYWLSPASHKARRFLISEFAEIVKNYPVDGLQLDYIRYPFQKSTVPMGLESFAVNRFESETGLNMDAPSEYTMQAWTAWRAFQVTTFVKELSENLKNIRPDLKLSAAVFPIARHGRMLMIQQDWETWVRNGWIETINPMAYSRSARSLQRLVEYIHNIGEDKALVYPGLSLSKLNSVELLDTLEVARNTGVMGTTLFAAAQFDTEKQLVLQSGPYRYPPSSPPHHNPIHASKTLILETTNLISGMLSLADPATPGQSVLQEIRTMLTILDTNLDALKAVNDNPPQRQQAAQDVLAQSKILKLHAEQWLECCDNAVMDFQAAYIKRMLDKTVRLVNYTAFQY